MRHTTYWRSDSILREDANRTRKGSTSDQPDKGGTGLDSNIVDINEIILIILIIILNL